MAFPASPAVFGKVFDPQYSPAQWHYVVSAIIAAAIEKGGARVIINTPPQAR